MAVTYQTSTGATAAATPISVPPPSGLASGDLWLVVVTVDDSTCTMNVPAGWNAVHAQVNGGFPNVRAFWKTAGASETNASFTVTSSGSADLGASSIRLTGQHATVPIGEVGTANVPGGTGATIDAPDITNVAQNGSLVILWASHNSALGYTEPSGTTEIGEFDDLGGACSHAVAYEARNTGAYSPGNWTYAQGAGASNRAAQTFVILPAAGGGAATSFPLFNSNNLLPLLAM